MFAPREPLCVHHKSSFRFPLKSIEKSTDGKEPIWIIWRIVKIDDYWNADGTRTPSKDWTGLTTKDRTRIGIARTVDHKSKEIKETVRQNGEKEQPQLDTARQLGGIFVVPSDDTEHDNIVENARMKLERQTLLPCHVLTKIKTHPCEMPMMCVVDAAIELHLRSCSGLPPRAKERRELLHARSLFFNLLTSLSRVLITSGRLARAQG